MTSPTLRPAADTLAAAQASAGFAVGIHEVSAGTAAADDKAFIRGELNSTTCRATNVSRTAQRHLAQA